MRKFNAPTFVPAEAPTNVYDPMVEKALTKGVERDFLVPALENLGGGVGVFLLVGVILFWGSDAGWFQIGTADAVTIAAYCGVFALAVACIVRWLGDEVQEWAYRISKGLSEGRTNERLDWALDEIERLHAELDAANLSAAQSLRTPSVRVRPEVDEYTEPLRDAVYLCRFMESHRTIARDKVVAAGEITKVRWEAARQLLLHAGVPIGNGVLGDSVDEALSAVRQFVEAQRRAPEGFVNPAME